jgi:pimeloyl-ACP methyl ester carboxylesterase
MPIDPRKRIRALEKAGIVSAVLICVSMNSAGALAQAKDPKPLVIKREGYFFVGGRYSTINGNQVMSGQAYAEYQVPFKGRHAVPIVFVPGGGGSGAAWSGTPDGREGWSQFFLRQGYTVYVVDLPGGGRSPYIAGAYGPLIQFNNIQGAQERFTLSERYDLWPQAHLHTQWLGSGAPGDPVFDQFFAGVTPGFRGAESVDRDALVALLDKIGPAILVTHSASGQLGWLVADARPGLVKAVMAVEPNGPPFFHLQTVGAPDWFRYDRKDRPWGLTAIPLTYAPAAASADDLAIEEQDKPDTADLAKCWLQKAPARQLPNLQKMPILVVTGEASFRAIDDHCTVKYLEQAGVHVKWMNLGEMGIHGNSHLLPIEKNNMKIAAVVLEWLDKAVPTLSGKAP